jgi:DNA polymerase epsilon subunit 1
LITEYCREAADASGHILDIREYDVTYYTRCSIDQKTRCGEWYDVSVQGGEVELKIRPDLGGSAPPFKVDLNFEA